MVYFTVFSVIGFYFYFIVLKDIIHEAKKLTELIGEMDIIHEAKN